MQRETHHIVQIHTEEGWETVCMASDRQLAKDDAAAYRSNASQPVRIKRAEYCMPSLPDGCAKWLISFGEQEGRLWRSKLRAIWDRDSCPAQARQIRNSLGPSGLRRVKLGGYVL